LLYERNGSRRRRRRRKRWRRRRRCGTRLVPHSRMHERQEYTVQGRTIERERERDD